MKNKFKLDPAALTVLLLVLSIVIIVLVASFSVTDKGGDDEGAQTTPELTFPPISEVPSREDVYVTHTMKNLEDIYEKDGIEYVYSVISYPFVEGGNAEATAKINDAILAFASERVTIESFEKANAEDAYKRSEQDAMGFVEFEFVTRTESVYVKNGYISIMFRQVRTVGINEPSEDITTMCFDLLSGERVDISAFLNVGQDSAERFILDVFSQHVNNNPNLYYRDALETLPSIIDLEAFYLTENGVILYFNPNLITPSVLGICELTIPYDKTGH